VFVVFSPDVARGGDARDEQRGRERDDALVGRTGGARLRRVRETHGSVRHETLPSDGARRGRVGRRQVFRVREDRVPGADVERRGSRRGGAGAVAARVVFVVRTREPAPGDEGRGNARERVFESLFIVREGDAQVRAVLRWVRQDWGWTMRQVRRARGGLERGRGGVHSGDESHGVVFLVWRTVRAHEEG